MGQVENLRPIGNRPFLLREFSPAPPLIFVSGFHHRRLPHLHAVDRPVFLTWRLYGSLPLNRSFSSNITSGRAFVAMDRILDQARSGPLYLRRTDIAQLLVNAIRYRQEHLRQFEMHSWVVMANHVHVLITPQIEVSKLMHSLKRFTARKANQILGLTGRPFWQDESYDHLVRSEVEFQRIVEYIEMNPVRAGLVTTPEAFPWSSAGKSGLYADGGRTEADCQSAAGFQPAPQNPDGPLAILAIYAQAHHFPRIRHPRDRRN